MHQHNAKEMSGSLVCGRTAPLSHFFAAIDHTFVEAI